MNNSLQQKIEALIPEERKDTELTAYLLPSFEGKRDNYIFNLCRTEVISKIPAILVMVIGEKISLLERCLSNVSDETQQNVEDELVDLLSPNSSTKEN